jgi:hypothetical protein
MEPHERLHVSLTLKKVKTVFLCIDKNTLSSPVQPTSMETITPPETTHFHGNHHTVGNNPRRPHNSEPDPPEIQTVSDWTTTPTMLLVGEGPDPGQIPSSQAGSGRFVRRMAGSHPSRPFRPFPSSREGSGRSSRETARSRKSRPFWPGNGRIPSSLPGSGCSVWERPGSGCFGRRTGSPMRPDPAMARGFDPFFSGHMMKGIFVFV